MFLDFLVFSLNHALFDQDSLHVVRGDWRLWYFYLTLAKEDDHLIVELLHFSLLVFLKSKVGGVLRSFK
jgi:hypothetical protein